MSRRAPGGPATTAPATTSGRSRADAWQLARAREAWGALQRGELALAPADDLARIFREAEQRAVSRAG